MKTSLEQFSLPWAKLCAAHPRYQVGAASFTLFHERLCNYTVEQINAAIQTEIDNNKYFPSPAEIIANIKAQVVQPGVKQLMGPEPTRDEAKAVLAQLHVAIREFTAKDEEARTKRIAARKAELKDQANILKLSAGGSRED